jgi:hypothetical protein
MLYTPLRSQPRRVRFALDGLMLDDLPRYRQMVRSEATIANDVTGAVRLPINLTSQAIEILLTLSGYHGEGFENPESPEGVFHWWASERARQSPFTMRAFIVLWERGHYIECISILRQLMESFVQLRYFVANRGALHDHLMATGQKGRVQFKTMFEAVSPNFYDRQYGRIFSGIAHSGMALSTMFDWVPPVGDNFAKSLPKTLCTFSERSAAMTANVLALLASGFLQHYPSWFPTYTGTQDGTETLRLETLAMFREFRRGIRSTARSTEMYDLWDRLIG